MSERLLLQVTQEGECTQTEIRCTELETFFVIGAIMESVYYERLSKGRSADDLKQFMRKMLDDIENYAFELAQDRYRKEQQ